MVAMVLVLIIVVAIDRARPGAVPLRWFIGGFFLVLPPLMGAVIVRSIGRRGFWVIGVGHTTRRRHPRLAAALVGVVLGFLLVPTLLGLGTLTGHIPFELRHGKARIGGP